MSSSGACIALMAFNTDANVNLKGNLVNSEDANRRVGRLQFHRGFTRIDKALEPADKDILTPVGSLRDISRVNVC